MPSEGDLFIASPACKYYWINKDIFLLIDGVLFRQTKKIRINISGKGLDGPFANVVAHVCAVD